MTTKQQIIKSIKKRHNEELKLADKFLDLKFTYPFKSQLFYKKQLYLITEINAHNYTFKARPISSSTNNGLYLDSMTIDLSEIRSANRNVSEL